jgi:drug/metabolite transporter (DMT)-like permease
MITGLAGIAILLGPAALREGVRGTMVTGFLILQLGTMLWSTGSIFQRRKIRHMNAIVSGGLQQLGVGVGFLIAAVAFGQTTAQWELRGVAALSWLVVFGSLVGYTSYVYALNNLPVALVTTHNYFNPLVATLLGWWLLDEPFGRREVLAMAVIFVGVAIVRHFSARPSPPQGPSGAIPAEPELKQRVA